MHGQQIGFLLLLTLLIDAGGDAGPTFDVMQPCAARHARLSMCTGKCTVRKRSEKIRSYTDLAHPIRVEHLTGMPQRLRIFRDFLTDDETAHIKALATPLLERSVAKVDDNYKPADFRVSQVAWFHHSADPVLATIHRRIERATRLNLTSAEQLQVQNYGA